MKIRLSKLLIFAILVNMFLPLYARAEAVSMSLYFNGSIVENNYPIELIDGQYFCCGNDLNYKYFTYTEGNGEIIINRYCTELKITFGSDTILVNGKSQIFSTPVYRTNEKNYISLALIALVYGSNIAVDESLHKIDVTLSDKPVLPPSKNINGSITLPNNQTAPQSGMVFKVTVRSNIYYYDDSSYYKYAFIDAGQASCNYSIDFEDNLDYAEYSVQYEILDSYNFPDYAEFGYYTYYGTKSNNEQGILIRNDTQVNIEVIGKTKLTGTLHRNGYNGTIQVGSYDEFSNNLDYQYVYDSDNEFELYVGSDIDKIKLIYSLNDDANGYLQQGYYTKNGSVPYYDNAEYIDMENDDISNIHIDVLPARTIKGTISYCDDLVGVYDYIYIYATKKDDDMKEIYTYANKGKGISTVDYYVNLPIGNDAYILAYNSDYMSGYIDINGNLTQEKTQAREFDISNGDIDGVNIEIFQPNIYGTISLPDGETAGDSGVTVTVSLQRTNEKTGITDILFPVTAVIPNGSSSIDYELPYVIADNKYYKYKICCESADASFSTVGDAYYKLYPPYISKRLDFTLIKVAAFSGTITLPDNMVSQSDITVTVFNGFQSKDFIIAAGESSCTYSVLGPISGAFKIGYKVNNNSEFLSGYFSENGVVCDYGDADFINEISQSMNNINIQILKAPSVSGIISIPEGVSVPENGIDINIYTSFNGTTTVNIPQGQTQTPYILYLQSESAIEVTVQYSLSTSIDDLWDNGYYSPGGVTLRDYYSIPLQNNSAENINFILMKKRQITGVINLPNNKVAESDIRGTVSAYRQYGLISIKTEESKILDSELNSGIGIEDKPKSSGGSGGSGGVTYPIPMPNINPVLIAAGQNSGTYTAFLPDDYLLSGYRLMYYIDSNDFYNRGYYAENATVSYFDNASLLPATADNIPITLLEQITISGIVTKPEGFNSEFSIGIIAMTQLNYSSYGVINSAMSSFKASDTIMPFNIRIPADASPFIVRYQVYSGAGGDMLVHSGFYKDGNIVISPAQAGLYSPTDNITDINFSLQTIEPAIGQEIQIIDMLDSSGKSYDIRSNIYNRNQFSIRLNNASNSTVNGKLYVSVFDKNNKVIETVIADVNMPKWSSDQKYLQFKNEPSIDTKKIQIVVWNEHMNPFSIPFTRARAY